LSAVGPARLICLPLPPGGAIDELDDIFPAVYEELKRVAHRHLRGERTAHTLGTTALVHEAYLELAKLEHVRWPGRACMLAAASRAMRRILIDYAVARRAEKRGGGLATEPLDDAVAMAISRSDELLALDEPSIGSPASTSVTDAWWNAASSVG